MNSANVACETAFSDVRQKTAPKTNHLAEKLLPRAGTSPGVTVHLEPSSERDEVSSGANTINFTWAANIWWVHGTNQADVILGSYRNNHIEGYPGADELAGLGGDDYLDGGPGSDALRAGADSDTIYAIDGEADTVYCGDGIDTVHYDQGLDTFSGDSTSPPSSCETTPTT